MDGTLAAIALIVGLTDMGLNHCGTGCLAPNSVDSRIAISGGSVLFQENSIGEELYLRYDFGTTYGPFQPTVGFSATSDGDLWLGAGALWTAHFPGDDFFLQLYLMPGLYAQGDGPDLGHEIQFRSGFEIGYEANNGWRWGISYDHRSNAELASVNPGVETLQLRLSIPLD
jgi:hypothetical protein